MTSPFSASMTARDFRQMVTDTATVLGWHVLRAECGGLILTRERSICAALVGDGEALSEALAAWLDSHRADGHEVYTWTPADLQTITKALRARRAAA